LKSNPNKFLSSGRTTAATMCQELILKRKGGKGNAYWCDPSVAFGSLSDFSYRKGAQLNFKQLLAEKGEVIGPYCIDDETRTVVFVETSPDIDPAEEGPFYFQTQRDNAICVYTVPFDEYHRVVSELPEEACRTDQLLMVYNTSRCGSTLLSKCINTLGNVRSISEPDVFTSLTHLASEANGTRDDDIIALAKSSAKLLCYMRKLKYPECEHVCIKFRFQMVYIAELMNKALPEAKSIFLYRNALDVIDSMAAAFINTGVYKLIRSLGIDIFYVFYISDLPENLPKLMPLMNDKEMFPVESYMGLGAVCPFVLSWISTMHYGMEAYNKGYVSELIRYEDLVEKKMELVSHLLQRLDMLPASSSSERSSERSSANTDLVFLQDAHANTTTVSRRASKNKDGSVSRSGFAYFKGDDVENVKSVLSRHATIDHSDFIIPGTLLV
jgi:hypothetical protein